MRVLVTGGAGNLARYCLPELLEHGHDVTLFARTGRERPPILGRPIRGASSATSLRPTTAASRYAKILEDDLTKSLLELMERAGAQLASVATPSRPSERTTTRPMS